MWGEYIFCGAIFLELEENAKDDLLIAVRVEDVDLGTLPLLNPVAEEMQEEAQEINMMLSQAQTLW